ncbi:MAG: hypothetical protein OXH08_06460 [Gammaproteobacteria bacterium]|nr:hypothetical protein [Gammaproteobacteria bacterium]
MKKLAAPPVGGLHAGLGRLLVVAVAAIGAACASGGGGWSVPASAQLTESYLLGCYDVAEGEWTEERPGDRFRADMSTVRMGPIPSSQGLDSAFYQVPPRLRLAAPSDDTRCLGNVGPIIVPADAIPTPHTYMTHRVRNDTLRLLFSTGFYGVIAHLVPHGGGAWAGRANTHSDNLGERIWIRPIELTPVACDSPPPVPSSVMRSVPRAVQLVGGATIALGEPLPESLETMPRRSGALTVTGRTEGLFGTTDSIAVGIDPDRGRVGRIQLIYLDPDMSSVVEARISEAYGPPARNGEAESASLEWRNRVARVWLGRGSTRFRVNLRDHRYWR